VRVYGFIYKLISDPDSDHEFALIYIALFPDGTISSAIKYHEPSSSLVGIGRHNKVNSKKDSGQAGMTILGYLISGLISIIISGLIFFEYRKKGRG
jgi:hypothetical protein